MLTIQQTQAGIVYVLLTGAVGSIVIATRLGLRDLRRIRASLAVRIWAVWAALTAISFCMLLAMWFLRARVYI